MSKTMVNNMGLRVVIVMAVVVDLLLMLSVVVFVTFVSIVEASFTTFFSDGMQLRSMVRIMVIRISVVHCDLVVVGVINMMLTAIVILLFTVSYSRCGVNSCSLQILRDDTIAPLGKVVLLVMTLWMCRIASVGRILWVLLGIVVDYWTRVF